MNDLRIINGTIVRPEACFKGNIGIKEGKIVSVTTAAEDGGTALETIDAAGMLVFPGMIDTHVHIRGGDLGYREDFASGTRAAGAGGVTTVLEMPIARPPASTEKDFFARKQEIGSEACVDYGMYGGAGSDNPDEIKKISAAGAVAFKTFLMPPVPGREKEFFGLCCETYEELVAVMRRVAETGKVLAVHSELNEYVAAETARIRAEGRGGIKAFGESRPKAAEIEAVKRVIRAAEETGGRASVCHVSTPEAARLISDARARGVDIHGETCPQYLVFNDENAEFAGVFARMKPPLRSPETAAELLSLYSSGEIEITGSDHAPYRKEEKLKNGDDIWNTFDGVPGLELSLRLLLNQVTAGKLTYGAVARNTAQNPADIFGLASRKGRIEPGRDADLVLVRRMDVPEKFDSSKMFTKSRDSAVLYEGIAFTHRIEKTILRGRTVFSEGKSLGIPGFGRFMFKQNEK